MKLFAQRAFCQNVWLQNVRINLKDGQIQSVTPNAVAQAGDYQVDTLLPALANLHSHSFQRAMAGMTEYRAQGRESFWTWRSLMYRFLDRLTPEHVQAFAAQTFMEMQSAGYASVGEFHYVHHQTGGQHYANSAELSLRVIEAAKETGIGLTHLPVLYTYGGADGRPLDGGQLRFSNTVDEFSDIVARSNTALTTTYSDTCVGIAPHSLRATSPRDLTETVARHPDCPIHIHIAEQVKEVEEIQATLGARPVEWLLDNAQVDATWCLIHATHMTADETTDMAKSGAVAGLCPITEANLGDGAFNGSDYLAAKGTFGIGSDSNVNISLTEELRTLEYSQRLKHQERNVLVDGAGSTGHALYTGAAKGGAQAIGRNSGEIQVGALADLVAIDSQDPTLCALSDDQLLDGLVFAAKDTVVTDVWSAGRHQVQNRHHIHADAITGTYKVAIRDLLTDL
jgi:formimidoylglutamate deiminase